MILAGCGTAERAPALPPVRLSIEAPADLASVDDETIEVSGTVAPPGTRVLVAGAEADVSGGRFQATVALDSGANVIDVEAGAPRRPAAMTAIRVTRLVPVDVPDVEGFSVENAADTLRERGLRPDVQESGGLLDELLGGDLGVCFTQPGAGERVRAGTTVTVVAARSC